MVTRQIKDQEGSGFKRLFATASIILEGEYATRWLIVSVNFVQPISKQPAAHSAVPAHLAVALTVSVPQVSLVGQKHLSH